MGLFRKRQQPPTPIGQAMCVVDANGRAFVNQQHHPKITPEAIGALAPITWAISVATVAHSLGSQATSNWLSAIAELSQPEQLNAKVNPYGVHQLEVSGPPPPGSVVAGSFVILPTNHLTGQWLRAEGFRDEEHALRALGALWQVAAWLGEGVEVHVGLEMLAEADIDFGRPEVPLTLPQMLLDHGNEMAALRPLADFGPGLSAQEEAADIDADPAAWDDENPGWDFEFGDEENDAKPEPDWPFEHDDDYAGQHGDQGDSPPPVGWYEAPDGSGDRQWWTGSEWGPKS